MILKLNDTHKKELLEFLIEEKELNLFLIGDLENYGFNQDFLEYWGEFDNNDEIIAVLMRFYDDFTVYSKNIFEVVGFVKIIREKGFKLLSGKKSIIEEFSTYIEPEQKREMHFAKLDNLHELYTGELLNQVKSTEEEELISVYMLHTLINGKVDLKALERLREKYLNKTGRGYHIINVNKEIVCSAETAAENSHSAMIVGVCTNPNYRKNGYATAVVSKLCKDLILEGKTLCLFYDNQEAGKIYKKLGFEEIGTWSLWKSKKIV